jgi:hypothetical protein
LDMLSSIIRINTSYYYSNFLYYPSRQLFELLPNFFFGIPFYLQAVQIL